MYIYFDEEKMPDSWTIETMTKAADIAMKGEGLDSNVCCVSVSFVSMDEIHKLNKKYRKVDRPTDVLSFPEYEPEEIPELSEYELDELSLGDVVICEDKAREQANEFGHSYERELIYLFVHSIYHLLGYDHEEDDDKKIMRAKEENVMMQLGILR